MSRAIVLLVGLGAIVTIGPNPSNRPPTTSANVAADLTSRWDVGWYIGLASRGYDKERVSSRNDRSAFFPAWPLTLRAAAQLVPRNSTAWAWTGAVLSMLLFAAALAQVHRVAQLYISTDRADAAVLLLAFYPFAIYFSVGYSESLYLLGITSAWYAVETGRVGQAVVWGTIVGLSRPNGATFFVPLLLLARSRHSRPWSVALVSAAGPLVGVALFSAFLGLWVGVPWQWLSAQESWGRAHVGIWSVLMADLDFVRHNGLYGLLVGRPYDLFNMLGVSVLALSFLIYRQMGLGAALVGPLALLPAIAVGGWPSLGRYSSVVFPAFIALAAVLPSRHVPVVVATAAVLGGLSAALFFTFRPLY